MVSSSLVNPPASYLNLGRSFIKGNHPRYRVVGYILLVYLLYMVLLKARLFDLCTTMCYTIHSKELFFLARLFIGVYYISIYIALLYIPYYIYIYTSEVIRLWKSICA